MNKIARMTKPLWVFVAALGCMVGFADPVDNTWTGASGSGWTAANFSIAPESGQRFIFPSDAVTKSVVVPVGGVDAGGVAVAGDYVFSGGMLTLLGNLSVGSGAVSFGNGIAAGADLSIDVASGSSLTFGGAFSSAEPFAITRTGTGSFELGTDNSGFIGSWSLAGGFHRFADPAAFGADCGESVSLVSGTLKYTGLSAATVTRPITISAPSDAGYVVIDTDSSLTLSKGISSSHGSFVKIGTGALEIDFSEGTWNLGSGITSGTAAISSVNENGQSPNSASGSAALQVLQGMVRLKGEGVDKTTVNQTQRTFVGTSYGSNGTLATLEIEGMTYNQGGSSRQLTIGAGGVANQTRNSALRVKNAVVTGNTLEVGGTWRTINPLLSITNGTVAMTYEIDIGKKFENQNSSFCNPSVRIGAGGVLQHYRSDGGSSTGILFGKNFDVEVADGGMVEARSNGHSANYGIKFEEGNATGRMKFYNGGRLRTYKFTAANTPSDTAHVNLVFDGGILEMTASGTTSLGTSAEQMFTVGDNGVVLDLGVGIVHGFSTPFVGSGSLIKTGKGTLRLLSSDVNGHDVLETAGGLVVNEGVVDFCGNAFTVSSLSGAGTITNGVFSGTISAVTGATEVDVPTLGAGLTATSDVSVSVSLGAVPLQSAGSVVVPVVKVDGADVDLSMWRCSFDAKGYQCRLSMTDGGLVVVRVAKQGFTLILR